jgi:hypothetical protein|tara:strand:+ start:764 stop:1285 length:522 start_codon:yes stop_codon:yes gene_type:complete
MAFIGKGAVLQVQQAVYRGATSAQCGSGSFAAFDSNFFVNISPHSSTSLILIGGHLTASCTGSMQGLKIVFRRDSSTIGTALDGSSTATITGNGYSNVTGATASGLIEGYGAETFPLCYVDKPNTTNQVSYSVAIGHTSGATRNVLINQLANESNSSQFSRFSSIIYAMELAQ